MNLGRFRLIIDFLKIATIVKNTAILSIIMMIVLISLTSVSAYEEIITFDQNSMPSLENCSRIIWYPDASEGYRSQPALRSGPIRNSGLSCVKKILEGPANIKFFWKVDQERDRNGELSFNIDNKTILICTSTNWSPVSYAVSSGSHTLSWEYKKRYSYPEFAGAGWIDDLNIVYPIRPGVIDGKAMNLTFNDSILALKQDLNRFENKLSYIEKSIPDLKRFVKENNTTIDNNISMILEHVVFIKNRDNVNLTEEINKYKNKIIILEDGIYHTNKLTISTTNVIIRPITKWGVVLDGNQASNGINIKNARNITLDSLVIRNSTCTLRIDNSNGIEIFNNLISSFKYYGILLNNSSNCQIKFNKLSTTNCNNIEAINMSNGSNSNMVLFNNINLQPCNSPSTKKMYVTRNSVGNCIQSSDRGYIQENVTLCRIYSNNEFECHYEGTSISAPLDHNSSNIWSFLAYDEREI
jgi:hypothetical protein